jgi:hypothetical protein
VPWRDPSFATCRHRWFPSRFQAAAIRLDDDDGLVLSIIGLSLDVVGAVTLATGLFSHVVPSTWGGDVRPPEQVAHDAAFGLIGAPLLLAGFAFQSLYYLDLRW